MIHAYQSPLVNLAVWYFMVKVVWQCRGVGSRFLTYWTSATPRRLTARRLRNRTSLANITVEPCRQRLGAGTATSTAFNDGPWVNFLVNPRALSHLTGAIGTSEEIGALA